MSQGQKQRHRERTAEAGSYSGLLVGRQGCNTLAIKPLSCVYRAVPLSLQPVSECGPAGGSRGL